MCCRGRGQCQEHGCSCALVHTQDAPLPLSNGIPPPSGASALHVALSFATAAPLAGHWFGLEHLVQLWSRRCERHVAGASGRGFLTVRRRHTGMEGRLFFFWMLLCLRVTLHWGPPSCYQEGSESESKAQAEGSGTRRWRESSPSLKVVLGSCVCSPSSGLLVFNNVCLQRWHFETGLSVTCS